MDLNSSKGAMRKFQSPAESELHSTLYAPTASRSTTQELLHLLRMLFTLIGPVSRKHANLMCGTSSLEVSEVV